MEELADAPEVDEGLQRVVDYYEAAGPDYAAWSPAFNMHFGYWRAGLSPWRLAPMLEQMNAEVAARLRLPADRAARVLDMGCGFGEVARSIARRHAKVEVTGLTITPTQVTRGNRMTAAAGLERRVRVVHADYTRAPVGDPLVSAPTASSVFRHSRPSRSRETARSPIGRAELAIRSRCDLTLSLVYNS